MMFNKLHKINKQSFFKKSIIISLIFILLLGINNIIYAKYILTRKFDINGSSAPFYFDFTAPEKIVFERTANTNDYEQILTTTTNFNLVIKNNDGTNFNSFATNYEITIVDSPKFSFSTGNTITGTINGGSKINDSITLNLKINDLSNPSKTVKLRITTISPYKKTFEDITLNVEQKGAIQTIEDLLDLSLSMRNASKYSMVVSERFKLTRNLDFANTNSYDNAYRTDYGNTNLDEFTDNLITEMTSNAGFLPIGTKDSRFQFKGVFNGGNYTISNLRMEKSLQENIGLFGTINGATIQNLTIANGYVYNNNETAGMLVGRMIGGLIYNVTVEGLSVTSIDKDNPDRDTYAGGIAGYIQSGATIRKCTNKAEVTVRFIGDANSFSGVAGGITAWSAHSTIDDCRNEGRVVGQKFTGGIAGFSAMQEQDLDGNDVPGDTGAGTITNCTNTGEVTTYITATSTNGPGQFFGGICGLQKANGTISGCVNSGNVSAVNYVGGICGCNSRGTLTGNTNSGTISAKGSSYGPIIGTGTPQK